ncbi:MAG: hypothetical protein QOH81_3075 [Sphingomonadales bacterium]|jgi:hypothetical protein|nr:hypothetical protein [Sphingomonadales bacterium]
MGNGKLIFLVKWNPMMRSFWTGALPMLLAAAAPAPRESPAAAPALGYADTADLALAAPVAAQVRTRQAILLRKEQAAGVRPGFFRFYVEADMVSLIRAPQALPARVGYVVDLAAGPGGKPPRLPKGSEFLIFAAPAAGQPGALRLVAPDAQVPYSPAAADRLRAVLREAGAAAPPPRITGIGKAFHVRGSLPGESETQIFLHTADGRPVSLSVLRRPGETPHWSVALSEIVDEAAAPPARDTLLWYRLACALPPALPPQSLAEGAGDEEAAAIRADYRLVLDSLGPCGRRRFGGLGG